MKRLTKLFVAGVAGIMVLSSCGDSTSTETKTEETSTPEIVTVEETIIASYEDLDIKPRFGGCDDIEDPLELKNCADKKMSAFISTNLNYPESASKRKLEGKVVVSFVVEPNGSLSDIEAITNFGGGLEEEAIRVIQLMNEQKMWWKPGWKDGKRQRVKLQLPINFKIS